MDDQDNPYKVIETLLAEVRQHKKLYDEVRLIVNRAGMDMELLSLGGAVNLLVTERNEAVAALHAAQEEIRLLKKRK